MVSCKKPKKIEKNVTTTQGLPNKKVDKVSFEAPSAPLSTNPAQEHDTRKPSHPNGIPALTTAISKNGETDRIHPTSQPQIQTTVWGDECKGVTSARKLFPAVPPYISTQPAPKKIRSQRRKRTANIPKAPTRERLATIQKSPAPEQNTTNTANTNSHLPSSATSSGKKANANQTTPTSQSKSKQLPLAEQSSQGSTPHLQPQTLTVHSPTTAPKLLSKNLSSKKPSTHHTEIGKSVAAIIAMTRTRRSI
jgi:hypothetical protein